MIRLLIPIALLTAAANAWQPAPDSMLTDWGAKITSDQAWREYPRPALAREQWSNLNGLWKYAVTPKTADTAPAEWSGDILVPFAIESALSGVKKRITAEDAIWYRREISAAKSAGKRTLLHFEAVDYQSTVWINDTKVGENTTGGNLPFSFDITDALKDGSNTLTLKVTDSTNLPAAYQLHGKQVLKPGGIWYTPVSGIWQTVWMESVPEKHIVAAKITPSISGKVSISLNTAGGTGEATVTASLGGKEVAKTSGPADALELIIPSPKLWSPDSPTLYDLTIRFGEDEVKSYTGLRETSVMKDANGHLRLALNGKEIFHYGTLDQGWWPDGLLTPPSDEAMASDIKFLKEAGFNTIRKHIKVEPRRYYTHCDRIGMLVWQDQVSSGTGKDADRMVSPKWTRLQPNPEDAVWPDAAHTQYMKELKLMMDTLHNHPSIIQWVPFNEAWGQHRTVEVGKWAVAYDPSRQINIASGGNFWPAGHIVDHHEYPHPAFPFKLGENGRFDGFIKIVGEFGGHGFPVEGHLWNPKAKNWGYGGLPKNKEEWIERYKTSVKKLADLRKAGIAGGIYTQTTDVEDEINGLVTYDRKVQKLSPAELAKILKDSGLMEQ
jgi:beta-galactosidase